MVSTRRIDPITLEVIRGGIVSICYEMGVAMERSSYSSIFTEGLDYSCAMFDARAQLVAQHAFDPIHLACMGFAVEWVLDEIGLENLEPGDVIFHNDPYRGGNHISDTTIMNPVFYEGELVAVPATRAHQIDMGGMVPGNFAGDATEIFQEGLRIPPIKIFNKGQEQTDVWKLILANVRDPRSVWGDMQAQFGSLKVAEKRVHFYIEKYGLETWKDCLAEIQDVSERRIRAVIENIPDGRYEAEDYLDDDGIVPEPLKLKCAVTVKGSGAIIDFTGSSKQSKGAINGTYAVAAGNAYIGFLQSIGLRGDINFNYGYHRPIKVLAPAGSCLNVDYPGACMGGNVETSTRVVDVVIKALSQAVSPENIKAACGGTLYCQTAGGVHHETNQTWVHLQFWGGGMGARSGKDGNNAIEPFATNNKSQSVEVLETDFPIMFEKFALVDDTPGPGKWRGGVGCVYSWRLQSEEATLSSLGDRTIFPAYGVFGGGSPKARECGHYGDTWMKRAGEEEFKHFTECAGTISPSKWSRVVMRRGDVLETFTPGGGGYGDPLTRDPEQVLGDVINEYVSVECAKELYGVVIDAQQMKVDLRATEELRGRLAG